MNTKGIAEKIIDRLKNAATELEEFQLQFALGKMDASEKYEEMKTGLNSVVHDLNTKIHKETGGADGLKAKFEELQLQLALGKADTADAVAEQKTKISKSIHELENSIQNSKISNEYVPLLKEELEKFKIKTDILSSKYDIESKKDDFVKTIEGFKDKIASDDSFKNFSNEIGEAFSHFKKAFKK